MNGIIQGKQEKQAGSLVWKKVRDWNWTSSAYIGISNQDRLNYTIKIIDKSTQYPNLCYIRINALPRMKDNVPCLYFIGDGYSGYDGYQIYCAYWGSGQGEYELGYHATTSSPKPVATIFGSCELGYFE